MAKVDPRATQLHYEKKKAIELIDSYYNTTLSSDIYDLYRLQSITCAIICVNNIIDFENKLMENDFEKHRFWTRVRIELIKEHVKQQKEYKKQKKIQR